MSIQLPVLTLSSLEECIYLILSFDGKAFTDIRQEAKKMVQLQRSSIWFQHNFIIDLIEDGLKIEWILTDQLRNNEMSYHRLIDAIGQSLHVIFSHLLTFSPTDCIVMLNNTHCFA